MTALSTEAANFGWLLDNFVRTVPGTRHTLVVSADGLLMAMSEQLDRTSGDQLAAIVSGMSSLTRGAARQLRAGEVRQAIIEMDNLFLFLMSVSNGSVLAVVAESSCDVGLIGYEMAMLVSRTEATLTPQLISEMRGQLPIDGATRAPGWAAGSLTHERAHRVRGQNGPALCRDRWPRALGALRPALEALVGDAGAVTSQGLPPEKRAILQHAASNYISVAELSALLHLAPGVIRILVSDLADQQYVRVHTSQPVEVNTGESPALSLSVLESVLNGISAL